MLGLFALTAALAGAGRVGMMVPAGEPPAPTPLTVVVQDPDGKPVAGAVCQLMPHGVG
jgi:hypothetical protein